MNEIFFISDLHFCHDREFLYKPRGFNSVWEMNAAIVENWNSVVDDNDDVYVLGDLMLNDTEEGIRLLKNLKGRIHIIRGNHDTDKRVEKYLECENVVELVDAKYLRYKEYHFYLSHFPTMTANLEKEHLSQCTINIFGHTHSKDKFYNDIPFMYNVACDAQNCTPVMIDHALIDMRKKVKECKDML